MSDRTSRVVIYGLIALILLVLFAAAMMAQQNEADEISRSAEAPLSR